MLKFRIIKQDHAGQARTGRLETAHGVVETPTFVPVATKGALRGASFETAIATGARMFIINTYHLFTKNRYRIVDKFGGLHRFIGLNAPLMTDSGGFQVFSLGAGRDRNVGKITGSKNQTPDPGTNRGSLVKITARGVRFKDPEDGSIRHLDPRVSMRVQAVLGADIVFAFDECTSPLHDESYQKASLERTHRWAEESLCAFQKYRRPYQTLFGIVQGGRFKNLRRESAKVIGAMPFAGFGIGGSFGKKEMSSVLSWTIPLLPPSKPRHLLGIGEIEDLVGAINVGVDLFDCVLPTRLGRHGIALTSQGKVNLRLSRHLGSSRPLDLHCACRICRNFSRAYLSYLARERELLGVTLLCEHNLAWMFNWFKEARQAINQNRFSRFGRAWLAKINKTATP